MATYSTNLQDLLRLAFEGSLTWLAGDPRAAQSVNWVALPTEDPQPGDILLLPAEQLKEGALLQAYKHQVAAVLVLGEASLPAGSIPADLIVVALPGQKEVRTAHRMLLTILISQRAALMERGVRIHAQLSQLAAEGQGLVGLARAMADMSGRGILIQDKRLQILADCPSSALLGIWEDVLSQVTSLDSLAESLRDRKQAGSQTIILTQEIPGGLERLLTPITVGGVARGYLSIIGLTAELDALDYMVAEQGTLVCAVEMARNKAVRETEKRFKGDLLTALLQENLSPRDARLWAQDMGLDLTQAYAALRFAWDGASPPSRRRLETLINGEVTRLGAPCIINPMGSEVICFCQTLPGDIRPEITLKLGHAVLEQAKYEYPETPARCGVGTPAPDLSDWRVSFRQAGQALEMARRLNQRQPLYFPDLSIYRLLFQIEHNPELIAFQEEILGPLLASEGDRELIHTLEAYFEHNGNLSQTAEALYIHRNTLIYRMERIAEIMGLDFDKPETRLSVQLALHIHRMRGGTQR